MAKGLCAVTDAVHSALPAVRALRKKYLMSESGFAVDDPILLS